jgi:demethylmenaquinone methyltransferase/2-methoxy-6-polyprenyl-1,4-benzoquinol methylase
MKWYDLIAPIYDGAIRSLYLPYRQKAVHALQLQPGLTVLDLGCGSGLNFELIMEGIGVQGTLIGVDFSAKMLDRAHKAVAQHGWSNVYLLQQDASKLELKNLDSLTGRNIRVDRILCTLGLSVFPAWQDVFERSFDLLAIDGRYCVMDLFNENESFQTRVINFLASSDISRRIWEPLQERCDDYLEERHHLMHGREVVIIASGTKPRGEKILSQSDLP